MATGSCGTFSVADTAAVGKTTNVASRNPALPHPEMGPVRVRVKAALVISSLGIVQEALMFSAVCRRIPVPLM